MKWDKIKQIINSESTNRSIIFVETADYSYWALYFICENLLDIFLFHLTE